MQLQQILPLGRSRPRLTLWGDFHDDVRQGGGLLPPVLPLLPLSEGLSQQQPEGQEVQHLWGAGEGGVTHASMMEPPAAASGQGNWPMYS